ncbi:MAG: hypothetical protein WCO60_19700 [Verrucomicrobiota bacterium]
MKKPVNVSLDEHLKSVATVYAAAIGRPLSLLIEELLRKELEAAGVDTRPPREEILKRMAEIQEETGEYGVTSARARKKAPSE